MSADSALPPGRAERQAQRQAQLGAERRAARGAEMAALRAAMPQAMVQRTQWLLWRMVRKPGVAKPAKIPYYANGQLRGWPSGKPRSGGPTAEQPQVAQGHELDRAHLVSIDAAIEAYVARPDWAGLGFAFLPGDGLIGIDVDHAVDAATGIPSDLCRLVVELCDSYTELSPSGTGVHVIVSGETSTFKDDAIGLEVYCHAQYFTCTGKRPVGDAWPELTAEVKPIEPDALAYLRELVDESKRRQAAAKAAAPLPAMQSPAEQPAAPPPAASAAPPAPPPGAAQPAAGADDFRTINDAAMRSLEAWVPRLFAEAKPWRNGFRVSSKSIGRDLQEDIAIQQDGIVDFGVADLGDAQQGRRTPIDLVMEWGARAGIPAAKPAEALRWLAHTLGVTLRRPALRAIEGPPPPSGKASRATAGKGEGAANEDEGADEVESTPRRGKKLPPEVWERVDAMCERYALVYSTDTAWDKLELMLVKVAALRLALGQQAVKLWLTRPARQMVRPADLVFEPGLEVQPPQINMFAGLDLEPKEASTEDVRPMLRLLRHLCADTRIEGEEAPVKAAMHWILCWQALPLQRLGTKMATAIVMHGAQGTGKNLYWDAWRDLFGIYGVTVTQTELEDKFNAWMSRKLAILGDEVVSRQEMFHNKNRLKLIVTQREKFAIRGMFNDTRWESNHANVVFLSNESEPLVLEDRDRRHMVIYTPLEADPKLYAEVRDFMAADGLAKWLGYLMAYPVGDFDAHTKPLLTSAKASLIESSWRPAARFGHEWLGGLLDLPLRVCSAEQAYRAFRRWCDLSGERWPPSQNKFTTDFGRWVRERVRRDEQGRLQQPAMIYKVVALPANEGSAKRCVRCWLPAGTGPLPGLTEGAWAADAIDTFERDLSRFARRFDRDAEEKK